MRAKGGRMDLTWTLHRLHAGGVAGEMLSHFAVTSATPARCHVNFVTCMLVLVDRGLRVRLLSPYHHLSLLDNVNSTKHNDDDKALTQLQRRTVTTGLQPGTLPTIIFPNCDDDADDIQEEETGTSRVYHEEDPIGKSNLQPDCHLRVDFLGPEYDYPLTSMFFLSLRSWNQRCSATLGRVETTPPSTLACDACDEHAYGDGHNKHDSLTTMGTTATTTNTTLITSTTTTSEIIATTNDYDRKHGEYDCDHDDYYHDECDNNEDKNQG
ncbi:hypothetical protein BDZ89DRAFT_1234121 [Hymenopellis radicata]|nr:hypothetical protein BDZ89DRAFT_1234121 [Hymenopellis radicata]